MKTPQYFKELLMGSNAVMLTNRVSQSDRARCSGARLAWVLLLPQLLWDVKQVTLGLSFFVGWRQACPRLARG